VCGIRYTPDAEAIAAASNYYGWVQNGLSLYGALAAASGAWWRVVEVFPTASWTRVYGPRRSMPRGLWSRAALASLGLEGLPTRRMGQDDRDAIAAAWTARLCSEPDAIEWFGDIAVPVGPSSRVSPSDQVG
jgi:predicted nuclease with RNAse H fold